jgi:3-hydroxyisobutyrate dehydrogenase
MGDPMVRCLLEAGHDVTVTDLRREATTPLVELGAKWADNARATAEDAEVLFTSLPGPYQVQQVLLDQKDGILAGLKSGSAWIDTTTNNPNVFAPLAKTCLERGIEVLDAPVSGRPPNMTIMVGGDRATYDKYEAVLKDMGRVVFYVGESGKGFTIKLVTQYMGYCNFVAAIEGMLIGAKAGLDLKLLGEVAPETVAGSRLLGMFPQNVFQGNFEGPGTLDIVAKDMNLANDLAREVASPAYMGNIAEDMLKRAQAQGWGNKPFHNVVKILEQMAGTELRIKN